MSELKVISVNGQLVTDSREVAKMIGKRHSDLLRDIKGYKSILDQNANLRSDDFFIESSYKNKNNQTYPCYQLTRKGCDMVANKLTGEKGVLFTAAYVTKFEEMQNQLEKPNSRKLLLETALEHEKKIENIESDVTMLKNNMRIDSSQEFHLNQLGKKKVIKSLGGYKSPAYQEMSSKVFARFWRDFKQHFVIPRYSDLPKVKFDEGVEFIQAWQPDTSTRLEIQSINRQQVIREVI